MIGDLHCHSRISDGSMGIDDLILYAKRAGLDFVALTDHDTMMGVNRAEQLGRRYGINVIGGAEFSTMDFSRKRKVHLLGYLPKNPDRLEGTFKRTLESRDKAVKESMHKVMKLFPVTEEHILRYAAGSASLYKAHIMLALMDLGYADSIYGPLFQRLLGSKGSCFVPHVYADVWETAALIKSAGGVCVLAHPSTYNSIEVMKELATAGAIDGIELYHPHVKQADIPVIEEIIKEYDLISTGGTDFHGRNTQHPNPLGTCLTMRDSLERIFKLSKSR
ncbi:PHP domain-containing protein [Oscillospiraceae bacterium PP1C4]